MYNQQITTGSQHLSINYHYYWLSKLEPKHVNFTVFRENIEFLEVSEKPRGTQNLLKLVKFAKKRRLNGPRNLSADHDKYFLDSWNK